VVHRVDVEGSSNSVKHPSEKKQYRKTEAGEQTNLTNACGCSARVYQDSPCTSRVMFSDVEPKASTARHV